MPPDTPAQDLPSSIPPVSVEPHAPAVLDTGSATIPALAAKGAIIFSTAIVACVAAYLAYAVPGAWFPRVDARTWGVQSLALARGTGAVENGTLVVARPDPTGIALVSVATDFRAIDFPAIGWSAGSLADRADVRLLWRSDVRPDKLNSASMRVEAGQLLPEVLAKNPGWIGRITGIALAIHDPLVQPVRITGVVAKPMGAVDLLRDRITEWFAFERWNGASINTVTGGADIQDVPMPIVISAVVAISGAIALALLRWNKYLPRSAAPGLLAAFFVAGWFALDARWTWNLVRQERDTARQYLGKDLRDKRLAGDDALLYAFVEKARDLLPRQPARIFVAADADYFRGRAAYHLYPHNVYFTPIGNAMPRAASLRPGDWLLVFLRRGIQYDASQGRIRWDGDQTIAGEAVLVEPGAALFRIRE
jgi:hypothetical protein